MQGSKPSETKTRPTYSRGRVTAISNETLVCGGSPQTAVSPHTDYHRHTLHTHTSQPCMLTGDGLQLIERFHALDACWRRRELSPPEQWHARLLSSASLRSLELNGRARGTLYIMYEGGKVQD